MPNQCAVHKAFRPWEMEALIIMEPTIERGQHSLFSQSALAIDGTEQHGLRKP